MLIQSRAHYSHCVKSALNRFNTLIMFISTMSRHVFSVSSVVFFGAGRKQCWATLTWELTHYDSTLADTGSLSIPMYSQDLTWCLTSSRSSRNTCWRREYNSTCMHTCLSQAGRGKRKRPLSLLSLIHILSSLITPVALSRLHQLGALNQGTFPKCEFSTWFYCSHPFSNTLHNAGCLMA